LHSFLPVLLSADCGEESGLVWSEFRGDTEIGRSAIGSCETNQGLEIEAILFCFKDVKKYTPEFIP